MNINTLNMF